jgi:hypothetical protein
MSFKVLDKYTFFKELNDLLNSGISVKNNHLAVNHTFNSTTKILTLTGFLNLSESNRDYLNFVHFHYIRIIVVTRLENGNISNLPFRFLGVYTNESNESENVFNKFFEFQNVDSSSHLTETRLSNTRYFFLDNFNIKTNNSYSVEVEGVQLQFSCWSEKFKEYFVKFPKDFVLRYSDSNSFPSLRFYLFFILQWQLSLLFDNNEIPFNISIVTYYTPVKKFKKIAKIG